MEWKYAGIDLIALALAAFAFYKGYKSGLINQAAWFGSFIVAYLLASRFCHDIAERSDLTLYNDEITVATAFAVLFLAVMAAMHVLARTLSRVVRPTIVGLANAILGGLFTSLIAIVLMLVLLNLALILLPETEDVLNKTWIVKQGAALAESLMERTPLNELTGRFRV